MEIQGLYFVFSATTPVTVLECLVTVSWAWESRFPIWPLQLLVGKGTLFSNLWCLAKSRTIVASKFSVLLDCLFRSWGQRKNAFTVYSVFVCLFACTCWWLLIPGFLTYKSVYEVKRKPRGLTPCCSLGPENPSQPAFSSPPFRVFLCFQLYSAGGTGQNSSILSSWSGSIPNYLLRPNLTQATWKHNITTLNWMKILL